MIFKTFNLLGILIVFQNLINVEGATFSEDTTLTKQQSLALIKFKNRVWGKLDHDWMKDDIYLLRFLRAKNFDVSRADDLLNSNHKWRKDDKMDTIHEEDWSDFESYTYNLDGVDREGRPLLLWDIGEWDTRKAAISGKMERMVRYTNKMLDHARIKVREAQLAGKNVTRWTLIIEMGKINAVQHINPQGVPYYLAVAAAYDPHFPLMGNSIYLINTPGLFEAVLALAKPVLAANTRDSLKVYGKDASLWGPILRAAIDPKFLPKNYGGTKQSIQ